ncbi:DNA helicase-2 / ATP-dependent DNA helicase PcrA [Sporobacter termitidis DSM 10068]|uniref:DNA 3'-5' helicase n=1 Tax=Sporobacter termitidis DSM 10068 TaxID=1123282 RepID=A0A1M5YK76_9FIRM|nr:UvrD-helicase domain-containing protein [Sporobacter termitidis]SHI12426.1 DNA helicase-2 / ATP-dependent DNA helicase PcrA [Sporobacter termitidis DSM 10068]
MDNILDGLNTEQLQAVTATEGFYRVIAGAGSGKTRALSHRFAYLVSEIGALPSGILCVTFTNKAAAEMKKRIRALTGDNDTGYISTFHSFCVSVLQEDISAVQYPKSFLVLDNADIDAMLKLIYEERGLTLRDMTFGKARDMIEMRKLVKDPEYYELMIAMTPEALQEKYLNAAAADDIIFWGYLYQEKKCFGLDYNDLIKYVLHIFDIDAAIRLKWQQRLEYIMIDEFQDIDALQYRLMRVLCDYHKNLFIVGDPDQTIYTWRGASVRYLLEFDKEFSNVRTIMMMRNYRSTPQIVAAANALIAANKIRVDKDLIPTLPDGAPVVYHHARTAGEEALWIAHEIKDLADRGAPLRDITILYRAHYLSRTLEEVFLREELPYTIFSGVQFFSRMEIKDALSYLRLVSLRDDLSFLRVANVPKRNLGQRRMKFLQDYAVQNSCTLYAALERTVDDDIFKNTKAKRLLALVERFSALVSELPVSELLSKLLDESGYEALLRTEGSQERLDNLAELKQSVHDFEINCGEESTLESYLAHVALMTAGDAESGKNAVKLMTVHTAKGLEFPYVFLCGLMEGVFPSKKVLTREGMEEERRLCFVAFTRAEKRLCLTDAEGRNLDGSYRYPSRFIFNVDRALLTYTGELDPRLVSDTRLMIESNEKMLELTAAGPSFGPGDRVVHSIMGSGEIVDIDRDKNAYLVKFDSIPTPRKISMRARLERAPSQV